MRTRGIIVLIIIVILLIGGYYLFYGNYSSPTPPQSMPAVTPPTSPPANLPAPATQATGNNVMIQNFAFSPATLTVKAGTDVTFTNQDSVTHTVTSDTGLFDSGNLTSGKSFSFTFQTPGTYSYHCSIHTSMAHGTIIVQ